MFWKDTSKTMLRKGISAFQKEESLAERCIGDQRHLFVQTKGRGRTLLLLNKSLLMNREPWSRGAVLGVLNEKSHFSWSLHSNERKERIHVNRMKTEVKGRGEMKAEARRMGQILQRTHSEQRGVANGGDIEELS